MGATDTKTMPSSPRPHCKLAVGTSIVLLSFAALAQAYSPAVLCRCGDFPHPFAARRSAVVPSLQKYADMRYTAWAPDPSGGAVVQREVTYKSRSAVGSIAVAELHRVRGHRLDEHLCCRSQGGAQGKRGAVGGREGRGSMQRAALRWRSCTGYGGQEGGGGGRGAYAERIRETGHGADGGTVVAMPQTTHAATPTTMSL